jgi:hypothetical protein
LRLALEITTMEKWLTLVYWANMYVFGGIGSVIQYHDRRT